MDPTEPLAIHGDHLLLDELGEDGTEAFLRAATAPGPMLTSAELRQLGGAFADPDPAGGVLSHLAARYAYIGTGLPDLTPPAAIADRCAAIRAALAPWDTGRTAPTLVESLAQPQRHLTPTDIAEVDTVRLRIDPDGLFRPDIAPNATALPG